MKSALQKFHGQQVKPNTSVQNTAIKLEPVYQTPEESVLYGGSNFHGGKKQSGRTVCGRFSPISRTS